MDSHLPPPIPPDLPDSANEAEDILLTADEAELLEAFRKDVRLCKASADKFRLCEQMRNRLLGQHTRAELLITLFERVMLAECPDYKSYKKNKEKGTKPQSHVEEWDRFIGVAASGSDFVEKCLPPLKAVSRCWGREKIQYYNWPDRGWGFCKKLGALANKMPWPEVVIKGNQLLLRRAQMGGGLRRHRIRESDPLDHVELDNLTKWLGEGPYVKDKDPDKVQLPFKDLSNQDLPSGYGFDEFGFMVRCLSNPPARASPTDSNADVAMETVVRAVLALDTDNVIPAVDRNAQDTGPSEPPADMTSLSGHSQLSTPLSSPPDSPLAPVLTTNSRFLLSPMPGACEPACSTGTESRNDADCLHRTDAPAILKLRQRNGNASYHETRPRSSKPAHRRPEPLQVAHPQKRCCPPSIPPMFLACLDKSDGPAIGQMLPTFMLVNIPFQEMCHTHLKQFAGAVTSMETFDSPLNAEKDFPMACSDASPNPRRRRASLPDHIDSTAMKRFRSSHSGASGHGPQPTLLGRDPKHDQFRGEAYRKQALADLSSTRHGQMSWSREVDKVVSQILRKSEPPTEDEAYFLTGEEAAHLAELRSIDIPVFAQGQQRFQWRGQDRPISQLFRRMEDLGLDRRVSVQIPSRSSLEGISENKSLREVRDRFLSQQPTSDPWNLPDLQSLFPYTLPSFLEGENCQLLLRVRDAVLMGSSAQPSETLGNAWNEWRNVIEWALLSEGGNNTEPKMDSHGFPTWITAQEGSIGFAWMSRPGRREEAATTSSPHSYASGEWRYAILSPGQTVFFPSGTIYFLFRIQGVQTFALGGHILQWSGIEQWLQVVIAKMSSSEFDQVSSAPRYVPIVEELIINRTRAGRLEDIGGRDIFARLSALLEEFHSVAQGSRPAS